MSEGSVYDTLTRPERWAVKNQTRQQALPRLYTPHVRLRRSPANSYVDLAPSFPVYLPTLLSPGDLNSIALSNSARHDSIKTSWCRATTRRPYRWYQRSSAIDSGATTRLLSHRPHRNQAYAARHCSSASHYRTAPVEAGFETHAGAYDRDTAASENHIWHRWEHRAFWTIECEATRQPLACGERCKAATSRAPVNSARRCRRPRQARIAYTTERLWSFT